MAVCCSSASFVSLNSRTFSMAITAWSAKVCEERDLPVGERPYLGPPDDDRADGLALAEQRDAQHCPVTDGAGAASTALGVFVDLGLRCRGRGSSAARAPHRPADAFRGIRGKRADRAQRGSGRSMSDDAEPVAVDLEDRGIGRLAQPGGAPSTSPRTRAGRRSASWR